MSVLFCKYLRKESLHLHEILCGGQLLSCEINLSIYLIIIFYFIPAPTGNRIIYM